MSNKLLHSWWPNKFDTTSQLDSLMLDKNYIRWGVGWWLSWFWIVVYVMRPKIWKFYSVKLGILILASQRWWIMSWCPDTRPSRPWCLPSHLFIANPHSKVAQKSQAVYGPTSFEIWATRAVLHRSSVDCEIWFHEGIDKIWGTMNTEYHFCRLQPLRTNCLWTRWISQLFGALNFAKMVHKCA